MFDYTKRANLRVHIFKRTEKQAFYKILALAAQSNELPEASREMAIKLHEYYKKNDPFWEWAADREAKGLPFPPLS